MDIHKYKIGGLDVTTGDIICTTDGGNAVLSGQFWWLVGKLIPGDVDHIIVYIGPEGRCVEAGPKGIITFEADTDWDAEKMKEQRTIIDTLYGIAYPLAGKNLSGDEDNKIRQSVAQYCLRQVEEKKNYNINFLNSQTEDSFYCSQLAYKAYLPHNIDLNTGKDVPNVPWTSSIIFPQEIWSGCNNAKVGG
jgi:uncharacterized protein YycO